MKLDDISTLMRDLGQMFENDDLEAAADSLDMFMDDTAMMEFAKKRAKVICGCLRCYGAETPSPGEECQAALMARGQMTVLTELRDFLQKRLDEI